MQSYGTDRRGDIVTAWSTDQRRSLAKIAQATLSDDETLVAHPRATDRPGRPSRFRIERKTP